MLAYVDGSAGASGDMLLAALIDAGYPLARLREVARALGLSDEVALGDERVAAGTCVARRLHVVVRERRRRQYGAMVEAIERAPLAAAVREGGLRTLARLAEVESALHGVPIERLHLHELSGVDTLVDIVGFHDAVVALGISELAASPLNVGGGTVTFSHGTVPVPAPATAALTKDVPTYSDGDVELLTPTGAAILVTAAARFGPRAAMTVARVGHALGSRPTVPARVLRIIIGAPA